MFPRGVVSPCCVVGFYSTGVCGIEQEVSETISKNILLLYASRWGAVGLILSGPGTALGTRHGPNEGCRAVQGHIRRREVKRSENVRSSVPPTYRVIA